MLEELTFDGKNKIWLGGGESTESTTEGGGGFLGGTTERIFN